ncbi:V-set and transmembrane domain-containing protein 5 [Lepidochelys kempii]|uniref:V-set and transmembrane domain-containing protein 5 n=1 Tax=Lepidochelys kempii TaxID=8472 RepID=UPI003C6FD67A
MDIYEQIAWGMQKGYNRDQHSCCMKAKELHQAYQKAREANSQSGTKPQTCCFYKELHDKHRRDPTTTPQTTTDTSKETEPQAPGVNSKDEAEVEEAWLIALLPRAQGGVSLLVPQPNINATVAQNILLSVEYSCKGIVSIEWKHVSSWGTNKIVEWKPGSYTNISKSYKDRVNTYENGSIQLLNVGVRDAGYYVVTITEELGTNIYGTIVLTVYEIIYEDLHFVAVFFAFLTAVSAVLVCCMWFCNKSVHLFQNKRDKFKERTAEEIELQTIEC